MTPTPEQIADLVKRLRDYINIVRDCEIRVEAADALESLQARLSAPLLADVEAIIKRQDESLGILTDTQLLIRSLARQVAEKDAEIAAHLAAIDDCGLLLERAEAERDAARLTALNEVLEMFVLWRKPSDIQLRAGEMTAGEIRSVQAVTKAIAGEIHRLANAVIAAQESKP